MMEGLVWVMMEALQRAGLSRLAQKPQNGTFSVPIRLWLLMLEPMPP